MKNTILENVFVCEDFLLTVKKTSYIENIRFWVGLRKMVNLRQFYRWNKIYASIGFSTTHRVRNYP